MTIKEFYEAIGSDYSKALSSLLNDSFARRMVLKFPADNSYLALMDACASNDANATFKAAHTLKGVSGNLGLHRLYDAVCLVVEETRSLRNTPDPSSISKIKEQYEIVIENIAKLD